MNADTTPLIQASPEDALAIEAGNDRFSEAFARSDIMGMLTVYTKDAQLLPPNEKTVTGHQAIHEYWESALASGPMTANLATVELDQIGDTAVEVGQYVMKDGDGALVDQGKYIVIWKKSAGQWKWHRDIWNQSDAP